MPLALPGCPAASGCWLWTGANSPEHQVTTSVYADAITLLPAWPHCSQVAAIVILSVMFLSMVCCQPDLVSKSTAAGLCVCGRLLHPLTPL